MEAEDDARQFTIEDWNEIFHGALTVLDTEERLHDFGFRGEFIVRRSPFQSDKFIISYLDNKLQAKHLFPRSRRRERVK